MRVRNWMSAAAVAGASLLAAGMGVPERPAPAAAVSPLRLEVDLSERKLVVYHGGEVMNSFDVAVGTEEHPTPEGSFRISRIIWNPAWVPPSSEWAEDESRTAPDDPDNPMVGAKLFFKYPDYYIHGTDAAHSLGTAASHGCIRMNPADVESLGEFIQEHGGEPRSDEWYERVQRDDESKHEVTLPDPVPIEIHG